MNTDYGAFGDKVWRAVTAAPFGRLTKRDLELAVLRAAIDAGGVSPTPADIAATFRMTLARAQGYLTDLSLDDDPYEDDAAVQALLLELRRAEVTVTQRHLVIPLRDARLQLWLERRMSVQGLNPGETLNRALFKVTAMGLLRLLEGAERIVSPEAVVRQLQVRHGDAPWVMALRGEIDGGSTWASVRRKACDVVEDISVGALSDALTSVFI